ncbi:MAG: SDR family oxidoreductase [Boseongicola sp.]
MDKVLLSIGHGYCAQALARRLLPNGWKVFGTTRSPGNSKSMIADGVEPIIWPGDELPMADASHILTSVAPSDRKDPVLAKETEAFKGASHLNWVGYLSTTGVYGDHSGGWVDEMTPPAPTTERGIARVAAESEWQTLGLPLQIFRLAGIYGPGRGPLEKVRQGSARRIIKKGQVFSRAHVEDIAQVLEASIGAPIPGAIYNICDDDPAPPEDVIAFAAELLGLPIPPEVDFEDADLSPMARSFYAESKRVRNDRIKSELGVVLKYPDYRSGLRALLSA